MKLQLISDVHLEFDNFKVDELEKTGDVLIVAGDLGAVKSHAKEMYRFLQDAGWTYDHVIYVLGNHEYYNGTLRKTRDIIANWQTDIENLHVLMQWDNAARKVDIDGYTFVGDTMWTDLSNPMDALRVQDMMSDYFVIRNDFESYGYKNPRLTARDTNLEHQAFRYFLETLEFEDPQKTVVVTHHSPSFTGVLPWWKGDPINPGYHSNLDNLIAELGVKYWFHGHIHDSVDYTIADTRVMTNPRGYDGIDRNSEFDSGFVVEL